MLGIATLKLHLSSEQVANEALGFVQQGGSLMIYGVYANISDFVHWSPAKI